MSDELTQRVQSPQSHQRHFVFLTLQRGQKTKLRQSPGSIFDLIYKGIIYAGKLQTANVSFIINEKGLLYLSQQICGFHYKP